MERPTKVKIGDTDYIISYKDDKSMVDCQYHERSEPSIRHNGPARGMCDLLTHDIWIQDSLSAEEQKITLMHEIEHGAIHENRAVKRSKYSNPKVEAEEYFVKVTAESLITVMKSNPEVKDWLFS